MCKHPSVLAALAVALWAAPAALATEPVHVELELVLAVDTSASVDDGEYYLQTIGIAQAFRDPDVIAAIEAHGEEGLAITLMHWSAGPYQTVRWMHVHDAASADRLAQAIERAPRSEVGPTTAIGSAMFHAVQLLVSNRFEGRRQSIDVSGDGPNNSGLPIWVERNRAVERGVVVNGLAILDGDPTLEDYYRTQVIGGPGAFVYTADDFNDFARAFKDKLLREITPLVVFNGPGPIETAHAVPAD